MKKMKILLWIVVAAFLFIPLAGCNGGGGGSATIYYRHDPWAYDHYYRTRVHHHHYHNRPNRPDRPIHKPNRPGGPSIQPVPKPRPRPQPRRR